MHSLSPTSLLRPGIVALLLSLAGILAAALVTQRIFEGIPHLEDEVAYVWQAKVMASGQLAIPSPPHSKNYLVPFVVDYDGSRFGKYPPGWPAMLSLGIRLGMRAWVNPLLAGLGVWLTYRLGKRAFGDFVGLLAAALTATSPFFLMNSGSLLSHPLGLFLSAAFTLSWLDGFGKQPPQAGRTLPTLTVMLSLGALILTRPLTAAGVALPFAAHGLYLLFRGDWEARRRLLVIGLAGLFFTGVYLFWQYSLTGDPLVNPYTLWWEYDKIGFGPGHGHSEGGHTLARAFYNARRSLLAGALDLFGWGGFSWIFLPFGLLAARRNRPGLLLGSIFPSLVIIHLAYWIGASLFGPRYYYEGIPSLTLFTAAGAAWLAGWPHQPDQEFCRFTGWRKLRPLFVLFVLGTLVGINLTLYTPTRLGGMHNLYGISRSDQQPFLLPSSPALTPALIIVHSERWMEYGALLDLEDPFLTTPFIFAWASTNPQRNAELEQDFPDRAVYHYYPHLTPFRLYTTPLPDP